MKNEGNRQMEVGSSSIKSTVLPLMFLLMFAAIPGCGIPGLRRAQRLPVQPETFNLNNGKSFSSAGPDLLPTPSASLSLPSSLNDKGNDRAPAGNESDDALEGQNSDSNDTDEASGKPKPGIIRLVSSLNFLRSSQEDRERSSVDDKAKADEINRQIEEIENRLSDDIESNEPKLDGSSVTDFSLPPIEPLVLDEADDYGVSGLIRSDGEDFAIGNSAQLPIAAFYDDPHLLGLINQAFLGNQELKILAEEIRIACNETYARSGEYRPFVSLGSAAGFEKVGRHTRQGAVEDQLEVAPGKEFPEPLGEFLTAANVSWEIDIWNRLRNLQRAAAMRYLATRDGRNYVVTRMVAELAENYYELLALDARLKILETTINIQRNSLQVAVAKKAAGRGTELAVQRFRAEVQKNESRRAVIEQQIVETENRLNFLVGRYPQPVQRSAVEFADLNLNTLAAGVPSDLLRNRADIREAERRVAAAGLDVQAARARFYPSLSLTAGLGWNAFSTGYLFRTPESLIYGMAAELVGPLINKRAIKAEYCNANAMQLQAIYEYQQTVLEAHIEVVNELSKMENLRRSIEVKRRQLDALTASVEAANKLFQNARAEYVEVLLAQRELQEAREELVDIKQEQLAAIVTAYQALGGGRM